MSESRLLLLSPYRPPTQSQSYLGQDETAAWLNGYLALWHPACLRGRSRLPEVDSAYDHEQPKLGCIYVRPDSPPLFLPDDWDDRVRAANAFVVTATADRNATDTSLRQALAAHENAALLDVPTELVRGFRGIGLGYLMIETLYDATDHEHMLEREPFLHAVLHAVEAVAVGDMDAARTQLREAARLLHSAREIIYPSEMSLLDFLLLDEHKPLTVVPACLHSGLPLNVIASARALERFAAEHPETAVTVRDRIGSPDQPGSLEICGGPKREREDALMPVESQLWNLQAGRTAVRDQFGVHVNVFARCRSAAHPQLPQWLHHVGQTHAVLVAFDEALIPEHRSAVISWQAPDGRQIDAFCRKPQKASDATPFFSLAYLTHQAIQSDSSPTLALMHRDEPPADAYFDLAALSSLAPVFGTWRTLSAYFREAYAGEYAPPASADEFFSDDLENRVTDQRPDPVSGFARQARLRRRLDAAWTYTAIRRSLSAGAITEADMEWVRRLTAVETAIEDEGASPPSGSASPAEEELTSIETEAATALAERLVARATTPTPGLMLLNPCSYLRRVALELPDWTAVPTVEGPIKAAQAGANGVQLVVEVPALGFAWIPRSAVSGPPPKPRLRNADGTTVRNEFFEAELDPITGGLRAIRDPRTRTNRLSQQLVYNPGSAMRADSVRVTSSGPALGEVVSDGHLLDDQGEVLAVFRQRLRAWLTRPMLELRIEIEPRHAPSGYPWHAYYGSRFAWADNGTMLFRGWNGLYSQTTHPRPLVPDFLEWRFTRQVTTLFTGGLPFLRRHDDRMLDVILQPPGEASHRFDLGLAIDREHPLPTAQGFISPVAVVPVEKGPPPIGPSGWLFHLDAPNLLLTTLRPLAGNIGDAPSILVRLLECSPYGGNGDWRCPRDPVRAVRVAADGTVEQELPIHGDTVSLEAHSGELLRFRIDLT